MSNQFERTEIIIGEENLEKLKKSKVVIFGIGGVGSYVLEALARVGIGNFILIDKDKIDITNINRQIIALHDTIGRSKVEVAKERVLNINPNANIEIFEEFFMPNSKDMFDKTANYVIDAVDNVTAKIEIIKRAKEMGVPVISSMGTANKKEPGLFEITDISKTSVCPLARVMRKELKNRNIKNVKVLYSKEEPIEQKEIMEHVCKDGICTIQKIKLPVGSISFVPSVAGLMIAGEVVKDIIGE